MSSEWEHPFHNIRCGWQMVGRALKTFLLLWLSVSLFGKQNWVKTGFQIEVLTLIQNLTENRLRHARGPVQFTETVTYMGGLKIFGNIKSLLIPFWWLFQCHYDDSAFNKKKRYLSTWCVPVASIIWAAVHSCPCFTQFGNSYDQNVLIITCDTRSFGYTTLYIRKGLKVELD